MTCRIQDLDAAAIMSYSLSVTFLLAIDSQASNTSKKAGWQFKEICTKFESALVSSRNAPN
jgi:hypothetical protein